MSWQAGGAGASVVNTGWSIASSAIVAMSCARSRRRVGITKENLSFHQTAHIRAALKGMTYRYRSLGGRYRGGVTVADGIGMRPPSDLFRP